MRLAIIAIVLVVLAGLSALFFGEQLGISGWGNTNNTTEVRVEVAEEGDLVESVSAPGWIEPVLQVALSAEVSAKVIEVLIDEGDAVTEGQLLVRLDDRELQADLKAAQARREGTQYGLNREETGLEARRRDLEFSQREVERVRALFESGDVSERELEQAESNFANAKTSVDTALIAVSSAETNLVSADADLGRLEALIDNTRVTAPMEGTILMVAIEPGEVVTGSVNNPGTIMLKVADLNRMMMKAEVPESDVSKVSEERPAKVFVNAYENEDFVGTVTQVALERTRADDGNNIFLTEIELELQGRRLRSGLLSNTEIEIAAHRGVKVPYQAVLTKPLDELPKSLHDAPEVDEKKKRCPVVFVEQNGLAKAVAVRPGPSDLTHRIVESGVEPGARVITGPYKLLEILKDGDKVVISTEALGRPESQAATRKGPPGRRGRFW